MTLEQFIAECEARCEAATPPPWNVTILDGYRQNFTDDPLLGVDHLPDTHENQRFASCARADLPKALRLLSIFAGAVEQGGRMDTVETSELWGRIWRELNP